MGNTFFYASAMLCDTITYERMTIISNPEQWLSKRRITMDTIKIGNFLAELRKEQGLTQEALGEKIGVRDAFGIQH